MQRNRSIQHDRTLTRHRKQLPQPTSPNGLANKTPKLKNTELPCICRDDCKTRTSTDDHSLTGRPQPSFIVLSIRWNTKPEKQECPLKEANLIRKKERRVVDLNSLVTRWSHYRSVFLGVRFSIRLRLLLCQS